MYSEQAIYQPPSMPPPMNNAHPPPIVEPDYRRNALSYSDLDMFEATNQRSTVPDKTYNSKVMLILVVFLILLISAVVHLFAICDF